MIVSRPIGEIFAVFEDPRNLERITPPWLNFQIVTPEPIVMAPGLILDYRIRWLGVPMRWRTRIADYLPPRRFIDEQIRGPFALWRHTHTFREVERGVEIADAVEYRLPLGTAGTMAHSALVRRQLLAIFRFRQKTIAELLGQRAIALVAPRIVDAR